MNSLGFVRVPTGYPSPYYVEKSQFAPECSRVGFRLGLAMANLARGLVGNRGIFSITNLGFRA